MKKIVLATIAIQAPGQLKRIYYTKENTDVRYPHPVAYPCINMMEEMLESGDDVKIVALMSQDANGQSLQNLEIFKEDLQALNERQGWKLQVDEVVLIPHEETRAKQISLYRDVCRQYEEGAQVYMDITFGTKITPIGLFSTLVYAENVKNCEICSVIYGKYLHGDAPTGELYDIKCVYDLNMLIGSLDPRRGDADKLLDTLWE